MSRLCCLVDSDGSIFVVMSDLKPHDAEGRRNSTASVASVEEKVACCYDPSPINGKQVCTKLRVVVRSLCTKFGLPVSERQVSIENNGPRWYSPWYSSSGALSFLMR